MLSRPAPLRAIASALVLALVACGAPDAPDSGVVVRDSAGVEIVEHAGDPWDSEPRWRVADEPSVRIGAIQGDAEYLFDGIRGVGVLSDGRIVVSNGGDQSLRWYDTNGRFLFQRGGEGEGPGEFSRLGPITVLDGDSIVAVDWSGRRFTVYGPEGGLGPTQRIEGLTAPPGAMYRLSDGSWVIGTSGSSSVQLGGSWEPGRRRFESPILRASAGAESIDTLGVFPSAEIEVRQMERGFSFGPATLGRDRSYAVAGDRIYIGTADRPQVDVYSPDGELVRSVRVPEIEVRLTPEIEAAYRDFLRERAANLSEERRADAEREAAERELPDSIPAYSTFLLDEEENLWVGEHRFDLAPPERYLVFGPDGRFRTTVTVPGGVRAHAVARGHIWGRQTDDLGVEYVVGYPIMRE